MARTLFNWRLKLLKPAAWGSLILAAFGGLGVSVTFVGGLIVTLAGWLDKIIMGAVNIFLKDDIPGGWLPGVLALVAVGLTIFWDIPRDFEPNRTAIYTMIFAPSIARSTGGLVGQWLADLRESFSAWLSEHSLGWIGVDATIPLVVPMVIFAVIIAHDIVRKREELKLQREQAPVGVGGSMGGMGGSRPGARA